jgi:hypothetical protein
MKTIEKYFIAVLILSFQITVFGQFNTLTPTLPKKTESAKAIEQVKETDNPKLKKEKNRGRIFLTLPQKPN